MTTTRQLLTSTLRLITVLGAGQPMTAEDATDSLRALNQMLSTWSADGAVLFNRSTDTKVLTSGVNSYTMGTGGDINTSRPISITQATITNGSTVRALDIFASNAYSSLTNPDQSGEPEVLYVNNSFPLLTLKLFPVPSSAYTLTLYSMKALSSLGLDDVLSLPEGFEEAIKYNLALRLAPEYEKPISKQVSDTAYDGLKIIKRNTKQYSQPLMSVDPILNGGQIFDIYGGYR